jgi:hypothetical protein
MAGIVEELRKAARAPHHVDDLPQLLRRAAEEIEALRRDLRQARMLSLAVDPPEGL